MMMPNNIRDQIRDLDWELEHESGWSDLSDGDRAQYYELWNRDARIGGRFGHFMDPRKVRVYIKDSLLKPYERQRLSLSEDVVLQRVDISPGGAVVQSFIKPHGRLLEDGQLVCWGKSRDWKLILMASFERAALDTRTRSTAVILLESGKTLEEASRRLVRSAASRLGVDRLVWMD